MSILDLFIERAPKEAQPSQPSLFAKKPVEVPPVSSPSLFAPKTVSVTNEELAKFHQHFDEIFNNANLPGPDYYEFSKMLSAMSATPMGELDKMKTAFIGLSVQGLTKEKLISSAQQYIQVIDADAQAFESAIENRISGELQAKKTQALSILQKIKEKEEMIKSLQAEIVNDQQAAQQLSAEVTEEETTIQSRVTKYRMVCEERKTQITNDITKINSNL